MTDTIETATNNNLTKNGVEVSLALYRAYFLKNLKKESAVEAISSAEQFKINCGRELRAQTHAKNIDIKSLEYLEKCIFPILCEKMTAETRIEEIAIVAATCLYKVVTPELVAAMRLQYRSTFKQLTDGDITESIFHFVIRLQILETYYIYESE